MYLILKYHSQQQEGILLEIIGLFLNLEGPSRKMSSEKANDLFQWLFGKEWVHFWLPQ